MPPSSPSPHLTSPHLTAVNTVIFYIAGFKLGLLFVNYSVVDNMQYAWALYPIVLFTRGVTIACLLPLLRRMGIGLSWQSAVAVWVLRTPLKPRHTDLLWGAS